MKNWSFDDPFYKKGKSIGARNDPIIRISKYFDEMRLSRSLRPLKLLGLLRSLRLFTLDNFFMRYMYPVHK